MWLCEYTWPHLVYFQVAWRNPPLKKLWCAPSGPKEECYEVWRPGCQIDACYRSASGGRNERLEQVPWEDLKCLGPSTICVYLNNHIQIFLLSILTEDHGNSDLFYLIFINALEITTSSKFPLRSPQLWTRLVLNWKSDFTNLENAKFYLVDYLLTSTSRCLPM